MVLYSPLGCVKMYFVKKRCIMIEILYKSRALIAIYKPHGIPSQPDPSGDADAMTLTREALAKAGEPDALWLIHRLDRVVGGIMIFARSKKYAAALTDMLKERVITKEYYAVLDGATPGGKFEDYIYKDARAGKAFIVERERSGVKRASLTCIPLAERTTDRGVKTLVKISLDTGRFHQIRSQTSHRSTPVTGDGKYGSHDNRAKHIALVASHINLSVLAEKLDITRLPDLKEYPWSLFDEADFVK